ncbi:MAG: Wzz/FepE/Etk N-terminal domain-containing protein [Ruminococcus sp.]|nr:MULTISPECIES: Wzz/FepE/Etk N-terminal domain-containing protein [Ruminococcus]MCI5598563.1 Wzz/FepE/Etk N-terminal domain-containing protein [Ruminococcus sp.]MCI5617757.1 Wzz/FepE/Etk N-terminal domain-containing protein [Ruminococcus sp.]MCI6505670.1 Wzz/FepE/Etk N-terminal domain-containing protein [Ruminococcus sp.]MDD6531232.1 Wzz/FepE/Etk N-terminal domain-containing protein [Ruminococcus sp.]MDD6709973.1 Wzz/FepE/Etk N-terminal domain-containing protein [Ruminococcus sp.]
MFYKDFTVSFFLKMILKRLKFIILLTLVGGILTLLYANFFITPSYSAQAMVIVQNYTAADAAADAAEEAAQNGVTDKSQQEDIQDTTNAKSFNDGNVKIYASDLTASSTLAQYCTILFKNNVEIQNMLNGCGMEITQEQESNFLWITMTSSNPKTAADTCNAVVNKITGTQNEQGLFDEIFSAGGVTAVKYASVPSSSTYPNVKNYALYGLVGGLALSLVISFILELVDTTVKHDDDLFKMYKIPVFGEIMDFEQNGDDTDEAKK